MYLILKQVNMKKQNNIGKINFLFPNCGISWHRSLRRSVYLSVFMASFSIQSFSQTETFDIATYTPPQDWKKTAKADAVNYTSINNTASTFCVISIFESSVSSGDAKKDFASAWKQLVATPYKAAANPQTEIQTTDDGWKVITAAASVKSDGMDVTMLLTVVSGFGKTMSIRTATNDQAYTAQLDALFGTMEFDKTMAIIKNIPVVPVQQTTAAGKFGSMLYTSPIGWGEEKFDDGVVFKPSNIAAGEHVAIQILPPINNNAGSLEQALIQSFDEVTVLYKGSPMYQSNGKFSKNPIKKSYNGWEYLRGKGGIRINDGTQFGTEYGLELFVIKVNNRFERVAILESRKYCNSSSLYYATDRRTYRNAVESFLFSLHFTDFNGAVLSPGSLKGNAVVGLWQGTIQSTGAASGLRLEVFSPIFLSNGQVYFGNKFPTEGLNGIHTQLPPQLNDRDWGTYTFNNGQGVLQMPFGNFPFRLQGDKMMITKNQREWNFYQLPSVNGATFNGTYNMKAFNGKVPSITFTSGGKFTDNGAIKELYHEYISCLNPAVTSGSGQYTVNDYSIIFKYTDGRKIVLAFLGAGYNKADPSPATIRLSYNEDPLTKQ
jgi:hypothetical protein